jgi:hypothetical protein
MKAKTRRKIEAQKRAERIATMTAEYVGQVKRYARKDGTDHVVYRTSRGHIGAGPVVDGALPVDSALPSDAAVVVAYVPAKGRVQWKQEG